MYIHVMQYTCTCIHVACSMLASFPGRLFRKSQQNNPVHIARCAQIPRFYGNNAHVRTVYTRPFFKQPGNEAAYIHVHVHENHNSLGCEQPC